MEQSVFRDAARAQCDEAHALIPAYCLEMTDPEETSFVEAMLERCPELRDELAVYRSLAAELLTDVPLVAAPRQLGYRLVEQAKLEKIAAQKTRSSAPRKAIPWRAVVFAAASAAAVFVVCVAFVVGLRLQQERVRLVDQVTLQQEMLVLVADNALTQFTLPPLRSAGLPEAQAVLRCGADSTVGILALENFPPTPPDHVYQVWLTSDTGRVSVGLVQVGADGRGLLLFRAPSVMRDFRYAGITLEPNGGSPAPTTNTLVRGRLY